MPTISNAFSTAVQSSTVANEFFSAKLASETDCSDVYADIKMGNKDYILLDVRSKEAYEKSHAVTAISMPHADITSELFTKYNKNTLFVVYCWGPGCNGATKAGAKISALGFAVKEMIGGIHYWEDFERYPVNRRVNEAQK
jgi:rhodanese-related sulfurtransferase